MKNASKTIAVAGVMAFLSTTALAATVNAIKDMNDGSQVSINGTVDKVKNERKFTLSDNSGKIDIDIKSNESVVLKQGDQVSVSGKVNKQLLGTEIEASQISVNKNISQAVGDAIEGHTPISLEGATPYDIGSLPKQGLVKISGKVTDVDNEKEFTMKDATGSIKVDVESSETAALTKGAEVTVIGYVDSGLFTRDLNARKVLVIADAAPAAR